MIEQLSLSPQFGEFERICSYWQQNHPKYLAHLRELALSICRKRGEVTIDDVREEMARWKIPFPKEIGADDRMFGSLLRGEHRLMTTGMRVTSRPERVKRAGPGASFISVYRLAEAAA